MNSIFNISAYSSGNTYNKHDIITFTGTFNGLTVVGGYLYCVADGVTGAFDATKWAGYILDNGDVKPIFLWTPSYNNTIDNAPKTTVIKYGDGYESRIPNSINNNLINYNLSFDKINVDELTAIEHFLTQRSSNESFIWVGRAPYVRNFRFIAREWTNEEVFLNNFTLNVKFEQVVN